MSEPPDFKEMTLQARPIRDLGLTIEGTPLQALIARFTEELVAAGITRVVPRYYLSTEWGVPFETIAVAVPFYLASPELTRLHAERAGHVEGTTPDDVLRYLRHEMGHVVNYAYRLYDDPEWIEHFGAITQPYVEDYAPKPFSRQHVHHLPGWYAQKHPDEDWAETFAAWLTPGAEWRRAYADWPQALAKLEYCDRVMVAVRERDPVVSADELDEDVSEIAHTLGEFYAQLEADEDALPPGLDGALRSVFDSDASGERRVPAAVLLSRLELELAASVYRWTGHFPDKTRSLLRSLRRRADDLGLAYDAAREPALVVDVTALVTALAMNHVQHGSYLPH